MDWNQVDWECLQRLRARFLAEETSSGADYWDSTATLAQYDFTFGRRIAWKWDAVLREVQARGWQNQTPVALFDWGCGTGVAAERYLAAFGAETVSSLTLWDRSERASTFAAEKLRALYPSLTVRIDAEPASTESTVLVSHVVSEMRNTAVLQGLARGAHAFFWVEPGTPASSQSIVALREKLAGTLKVVAPCPHQERCGLTVPENARHWCHHFAEPPNEVFTTAGWDQFSRTLHIDRRSLPVSFLVLAATAAQSAPERVIGRPRRYKGYCLYLGCDAKGVSERRLLRKQNPERFDLLQEDRFTYQF